MVPPNGGIRRRRKICRYANADGFLVAVQHGHQRLRAQFFEGLIDATARDLAETVSGCFSDVEWRKMNIHPATKVFQAIRIEVNGELSVIKTFLWEGMSVLRKGGRMAVITFHSGEDALVKRTFAEMTKGCVCPAEFPKCVCGRTPLARTLSPKFIIPGEAEIATNPRARSAKLRVAERL